MYDYTFWTLVMAALTPFSIAFSLVIPLIYYVYPESRQHPNSILVCICLAEIMQSFHLTFEFAQTFIGDGTYYPNLIRFLEILRSLMPLEVLDALSQWENIKVRAKIIFMCCVLVQQSLQLIWCIELILTLTKPLLSSRRRVIFYIGFATSNAFVQLYSLQKALNDLGDLPPFYSFYLMFIFGFNRVNNPYFYFIMILCLTLWFTLGFIIIQLYGLWNQKHSPLRSNKKAFLIQQLLMLSIIIFLWLLEILFLWLGIYLFPAFVFGCLAMQSQGMMMCIVRLQDQFFQEKIHGFIKKVWFRYCLRRKDKVRQEDSHQNDWNVPLTNLIKMVEGQEIICAIIFGIQTALEKSGDLQQHTLPKKSFIVVQPFQMEYNPMIRRISLNINETQQEMLTSSLSFNSSPMKITEHQPKIFRELRNLDDITDQIVKNSLDITNNQTSIEKLSESMGKSGAFFFFSEDSRFIIKTLTTTELQFLKDRLLPSYRQHILQNPCSMLSRMYGCFTIDIQNVSPIHLLLMENSFRYITQPEQVFDLKGSLIGRWSDSAVQKDVNLLESKNPIHFFNENSKDFIATQIENDSVFLKGIRIMDYSLLMGIKRYDKRMNEQCELKSTRLLKNDYSLYSLSIIDYLQEFNFEKYIENKYKSIFNPHDQISSVNPSQYSDRFIGFANQIFAKRISYDE